MPIPVNKNLTPEMILERVSELDICRTYVGDVRLNALINSPLRSDDHTPSFRIYLGPSGDVRFVDYGTGKRGSVFDLVAELYPGLSFREILRKIWDDRGCDRITPLYSVSDPKKSIVRNPYPEIMVRKRHATDQDVNLWASWGITVPTLEHFKVSPIDRFWMSWYKGSKNMFVCRTPTYSYDLDTEWKIYRPLEKTMRFIAGGPSLQGYSLLPSSGEICVIQKSYKDAMLLYEFGIPSFAPQAESIDVPEKEMESILKRFERVVIWGDPDPSGNSFNERHIEKYGISGITNDDGTKDITDHCKQHGKKSAEEMTRRLLQM